MVRNKVLLVFCLLPMLAAAQLTGTGEWRLHLPFRKTLGVAETPRYVYTWAEMGFYRFDKEVNASEKLSKIQGFSDIEVSVIRYNPAKDVLLIAYQDGNIDMITNGQIINIPDIKRSSVSGVKKVNNIYFHNQFAYLACAFGVVVIDLDRIETKDSYDNLNIGDINDFGIYNNDFYAGTSKGVYKLPANANPRISTNWQLADSGATRLLQVFEGRLFSVKSNRISYYDGSTWANLPNTGNYNSVYATDEKALFTKLDTIVIIDKNFAISEKLINTVTTAITNKNGDIWFTTNNAGTIKLSPNGEYTFTAPNGPYSTRTGQMASYKDEVVIAGGSITSTFNFTFSLNGYYRFVDDKWTNSLDNPNPATDTLNDFYAVAADPKTGDIWIAAYWQGLVQLRNGVVQNVYNSSNSPLKFDIVKYVTGMTVDKDGNLWLSNYGADSALVVRSPKGGWATLSLGSFGNIAQIIVDNSNRKWMVAVAKGATTGFGLVVYDDNKTPFNPNDDPAPRMLSQAAGQGGLPDNKVLSIAKDRDGEIWVGTAKGLTVFSNPSNIFSNNPSDARQIIIGEGTDIGYLLGTEVINCIFVDGGNRKWIGTNNGAWLVAQDGQKILQYFNEENSPLLSNEVTQITVNEATGEVFFATTKGLISYKGDATVATEKHSDVLVYPNPVREDYDGEISIRGLAQDAYVKITDIAGNVIYETQANGGMATWNGRNFEGRRASTGVYLVFSGTSDASDTHVAKILVINGGN